MDRLKHSVHLANSFNCIKIFFNIYVSANYFCLFCQYILYLFALMDILFMF